MGSLLGQSRGPAARPPLCASHKSDNYLFRFHPDSLSAASEEEPHCVNDSEGAGGREAVINSGGINTPMSEPVYEMTDCLHC